MPSQSPLEWDGADDTGGGKHGALEMDSRLNQVTTVWRDAEPEGTVECPPSEKLSVEGPKVTVGDLQHESSGETTAGAGDDSGSEKPGRVPVERSPEGTGEPVSEMEGGAVVAVREERSETTVPRLRYVLYLSKASRPAVGVMPHPFVYC